MELSSLIRPELVFPNVSGRDSASLLLGLAMKIAEAGAVRDAGDLYNRLQERESLGSTALGGGVAIPHCKLDGLERVLVAVATSAEEVEFGAEDGRGVRLFFVVLSPTNKSADHLQSLAAISKWIKGDPNLAQVLESDDPEEIVALLREDQGDQ